jgi:hypothetical protein
METTKYRTNQFLINSSHFVSGNTFRYSLPAGRTLSLDNDSEIAITKISMYNSTFNIKAEWGNNKIVLISNQFNLASSSLASYVKGTSYVDNGTTIQSGKKYVEITIPNGYYDINSLNNYLSFEFQKMNFYFQSTDGADGYFFFDCLTNPVQYKCQINLSLIPTSLPGGFVLPSNPCFTLPSTATTIQVYFPSVPTLSPYGNLGRIFGFKPSSVLPLSNVLTASSTNLSEITPRVSPITSYLIACNLVDNPSTNPSNILTQLNLGDSKFGGIIPYNDYPVYVSSQPQQASSIVITLFDEYLNDLEINDSQCSIILSVKTKIN